MKIFKYLILIFIICLLGFCVWYFTTFNILKRSLIHKYQGIEPYQWEQNVDGVKRYIDTRYDVVSLTFNFSGEKLNEDVMKSFKYLIDNKIPATLFVSGKWIDNNTKTLRMLSKYSFLQIENYGLNAKALSVNGRTLQGAMSTESIEEVAREIYENAQSIKKYTSKQPSFYRPGFGYADEIAVKIANDMGYEVVGFSNILRDDDKKFKESLNSIEKGDIIFFNLDEKDASVQLVKAIKFLKDKGIKFSKLSEFGLTENKKGFNIDNSILLPKLSKRQIEEISKLIYANECSSNPRYLIHWNEDEDFPSLGIGHFIWYPQEIYGPYTETFSQLIDFIREKGYLPPKWLIKNNAPWKNRDEFLKEKGNAQYRELQEFLLDTMDEQVLFIIDRAYRSFGKILEQASDYNRENIKNKFLLVANAPYGMYAIVDYVNFKGEGISSKERYNNQGWGLLQVLEEMKSVINSYEALQEFSAAADRVLTRRVNNAPESKNEQRWLAGWKKRVHIYAIERYN